MITLVLRILAAICLWFLVFGLKVSGLDLMVLGTALFFTSFIPFDNYLPRRA
jgi:hypothetical protein